MRCAATLSRRIRGREAARSGLRRRFGPAGSTAAFLAAFALVAGADPGPAPATDARRAPSVPPCCATRSTACRREGRRRSAIFRGKVLVIVNTASYCGYTKQYEGLEALYRKYKGRGLVVIGFPSNDFGAQEPGSNKQIAEFCRTTYGVEFPMFEKTSVARLETQPLYASLVRATGEAPKWNFHKYVVDRTGTKVASYESAIEPTQRDFVASIERLLAEKP